LIRFIKDYVYTPKMSQSLAEPRGGRISDATARVETTLPQRTLGEFQYHSDI